MQARTIAFVAVAALPLACTGSDARDALASLTADAFSPRYHSGFWAAEASKRTQLWRDADQLCRAQQANSTPNCRVVLAVDLTVQIIAVREGEDLAERLNAWIRGGTRELGLPNSRSMPPAAKGFGPALPKMPPSATR